MDYAAKMTALFMGIFIFFIYLGVFGILHGKLGMLAWTVIGFVAAMCVGWFIE